MHKRKQANNIYNCGIFLIQVRPIKSRLFQHDWAVQICCLGPVTNCHSSSSSGADFDIQLETVSQQKTGTLQRKVLMCMNQPGSLHSGIRWAQCGVADENHLGGNDSVLYTGLIIVQVK